MTRTRETATLQIRVRPSLLRQIVTDAEEATHEPPTANSAIAWLYGEYKRLKEAAE
jgi:hypothetical protein